MALPKRKHLPLAQLEYFFEKNMTRLNILATQLGYSFPPILCTICTILKENRVSIKMLFSFSSRWFVVVSNLPGQLWSAWSNFLGSETHASLKKTFTSEFSQNKTQLRIITLAFNTKYVSPHSNVKYEPFKIKETWQLSPPFSTISSFIHEQNCHDFTSNESVK